MKKTNRWKYIIPILIGLIVTGCIPKRFEWSPDGKWMTILSGLGLRVCDDNGNLLPGTVPNVGVATWFPDSKHILAASKRTVASWAELQPILSPDQIQAITTEAARVKTAAMDFDWTKKDWQAFGEHFDYKVDDTLKAPIALYLSAHPDETWNQKIPPNRRDELAAITTDVYDLIAVNVYTSGLAGGPPIYSTLQTPLELRMSPTGKAVILVTPKPGVQDLAACQLTIVSTDGTQQPLDLPGNASWYPDWTPDGTSVVFAAAAQSLSKDASLGTLRREQVIGSSGNILTASQNSEDLAGMIFSSFSRVRCLSDGRIIFASAQVTLPATPNDLPQHMELFSLAPGQAATITRLFPRQTVEQMGDAAEFFEVSPDNRYVSIPDEKGKIYVVTLASGEVQLAQPDDFTKHGDDPQLVTTPSWRTGDELTFAAPGEDNAHMKVILYLMPNRGGATRSLSNTWPADWRSVNMSPPPATQP